MTELDALEAAAKEATRRSAIADRRAEVACDKCRTRWNEKNILEAARVSFDADNARDARSKAWVTYYNYKSKWNIN